MSKRTDKKEIEAISPYVELVNSKYLHWDELPMRFKNENIDLKLLWSYVWFAREFNKKNLKFDSATLRYLQTPLIEKALHTLDMQIGSKIDIDAQMPSTTMQKKYLINSLMEEAIASSQLEGAATTRKVAKRMLQENRKPHSHSERMILNNYITMRFIKENAKQGQLLTIDLIKQIQVLITKDTLKEKSHEGTFRVDNEVKVFWQGQEIYQPPDYKLIDQLMKGACDFANSESSDYYIHPIIKAIVLHFMIGYIHPFNDGNGRTARGIFYWYLIAQGYDYLEYIAVSTAIKSAPAKYARAYLFAETDNNDVTYFVKFNLRALSIAVDLFNRYIEKTKRENRKIIETIRSNPKLGFRQADVIVNLSKTDRQITMAEMQGLYHITYETARTDLLDLVKLGYMHKYKVGRQFFFDVDKEKCMELGSLKGTNDKKV